MKDGSEEDVWTFERLTAWDRYFQLFVHRGDDVDAAVTKADLASVEYALRSRKVPPPEPMDTGVAGAFMPGPAGRRRSKHLHGKLTPLRAVDDDDPGDAAS